MIDNKSVIIAIIILIFFYIVIRMYSHQTWINHNTENLNNTTVTETKSLLPSDDIIATKVYEYIKLKDEDFPEYIQFLKNINNTNLKLIDAKVFYELKTLKKYNNLSSQSVLNIMTSRPG